MGAGAGSGTEQDGSDDIIAADFFKSGGLPALSGSVLVQSVENTLEEHLYRLCLGAPLLDDMTVDKTLAMITAKQGKVVEGSTDEAFTQVP
jgi:hypothetical protein